MIDDSDAAETPLLPEYVRYHWSASKEVTFFRFEASTKMRAGGFSLPYLSLGTDVEVALARYDAEVLPLLDAWRENRLHMDVEKGPGYGTLRWAFETYKTTLRFSNQAKITKDKNEDGFNRICNHRIRSGRHAGTPFGDLPLGKLTPAFVDEIYAEYRVVPEVNADGEIAERVRSCTSRKDFEGARAMINAIFRKHGHLLYDKKNPFSGMYMPHKARSRLAVNLKQLAAFIRTADRMHLFSISAIILYAFELEARVMRFPHECQVGEFKGRFHEDEIFVRADKVDQQAYFRLFDDRGEPLYPALIERLDALKAERISGPLFPSELSDPSDPKPWTRKKLGEKIREICEAAGLNPLVLSQFRKGGLTESGLAGLTTSQIMAQSFHLTEEVLHKYVEKGQNVAMKGQKRRLKFRKKAAKRGVDIVT